MKINVKKTALITAITVVAALCTILGINVKSLLQKDPVDPVIKEANAALKYAQELEASVDKTNAEPTTDLLKTRQTKEYLVQSIADMKEKLELINKEGSPRKLKKMENKKLALTIMQIVQTKQELSKEIIVPALTKVQDDIGEYESLMKSTKV